jgi:hypothetical protein
VRWKDLSAKRKKQGEEKRPAAGGWSGKSPGEGRWRIRVRWEVGCRLGGLVEADRLGFGWAWPVGGYLPFFFFKTVFFYYFLFSFKAI